MNATWRALAQVRAMMARKVAFDQVGRRPPKNSPSAWPYWPPVIACCRAARPSVAAKRSNAARRASTVAFVQSRGATNSCRRLDEGEDRKSTRVNSSHLGTSYAVFCLKKKKKKIERETSAIQTLGTLRYAHTCYSVDS